VEWIFNSYDNGVFRMLMICYTEYSD